MATTLTRGALRGARGTLVAALTTALAVAAHTGAGGVAPSAPALIALAAALLGGAVALSGQRWTARPLLALFLLAQAVIHGVAMVEHPEAAGHGLAMTASHVLAAVLLVVVVLHGERTLADLIDHLLLRSRRLLARAVPAVAAHRAAAAHPRPVAALVPADVLGRAPPVLS